MWRSLSGRPVGDVKKAVQSLLKGLDQVIHVGTDSQHSGYHTNFVTVIAVVTPGSGGRLFYQRARTPRARSLAHKLFREAELSIVTALAINDAIAHDIVVHVDANEDLRHRSSQYVRALSGMVLGHGLPGARQAAFLVREPRGGLPGQGQAPPGRLASRIVYTGAGTTSVPPMPRGPPGPSGGRGRGTPGTPCLPAAVDCFATRSS